MQIKFAPPQSEREEIDEENHSLVEDDRILLKYLEKSFQKYYKYLYKILPMNGQCD